MPSGSNCHRIRRFRKCRCTFCRMKFFTGELCWNATWSLSPRIRDYLRSVELLSHHSSTVLRSIQSAKVTRTGDSAGCVKSRRYFPGNQFPPRITAARFTGQVQHPMSPGTAVRFSICKRPMLSSGAPHEGGRRSE